MLCVTLLPILPYREKAWILEAMYKWRWSSNLAINCTLNEWLHSVRSWPSWNRGSATGMKNNSNLKSQGLCFCWPPSNQVFKLFGKFHPNLRDHGWQWTYIMSKGIQDSKRCHPHQHSTSILTVGLASLTCHPPIVRSQYNTYIIHTRGPQHISSMNAPW